MLFAKKTKKQNKISLHFKTKLRVQKASNPPNDIRC